MSDREDAEYEFERGVEFYKQQQYDAAETACRRAIALDPDFVFAWHGLGSALDDQDRHDEAETTYRHAIALDPACVFAWRGLGNALWSQSRYNEAETAYRHATTLDPAYVYAWSGLGDALHSQNRDDEAETAYRRAIALDAGRAAPWNGLGNALNGQRRYDEAETAYRRAIALDPAYVFAWNGLGNALWSQSRYNEAETTYRHATTLDPAYVNAWNGLGNALNGQRRYDEAETTYRRAIALDAGLAAPWNGLGNALNGRRRHDEAETACRRAIALNPDFVHAWSGLGNALWSQGRHDEAETAYGQATTLDPAYVHAWNGLGNALHSQGRHDEAETACRRAIALNPDFVHAWSGLGNALWSQNRDDEAETTYRRAIALDPGFASAHFNLGLVLDGLGRWREAFGCFAAAVRHAPGNANLIRQYREALAGVERLGAAVVLGAFAESEAIDVALDVGRGSLVPSGLRGAGREWSAPGTGFVRELVGAVRGRIGEAATADDLEPYRVLAEVREGVLWAATSAGERADWLTEFAGLGREAAFRFAAAEALPQGAAFIFAEPADLAAEMLERGLAVQLGQAAGIRLADMGPVRRAGRADLATAYEAALAARNAVLEDESGAPDDERWMRLRLARVRLDALTRAIRGEDPGFGQPLRWPGIAALSRAVPLVYVTSGVGGGLGLVVRDGRAERIAGLDRATDAALAQVLSDWRERYRHIGTRAAAAEPRGRLLFRRPKLPQQGTGTPAGWERAFAAALSGLWDLVVGPVVAALQKRGLDRAIVIAAGDLAGLPLQLAWHEVGGARRYALDEVTLWQAPSGRLLEAACRLPEGGSGRVLAILDDREVSSAGPIPAQARVAEQSLREIFGDRLVVLKGAAATRAAVLAELGEVGMVYFLGHGAGARGAAEESLLHLPSAETLRLGDVAALHLTQRLWLIVACEGARTGEAHPDEAMAFPAGLMSAGVAGVIAAPCVVDAVHAVPVSLAAMEGIAAGTHPAAALQAAQQAQAAGRLTAIDSDNGPRNLLTMQTSAFRPADDPLNPAHWAFQYSGP